MPRASLYICLTAVSLCSSLSTGRADRPRRGHAFGVQVLGWVFGYRFLDRVLWCFYIPPRPLLLGNLEPHQRVITISSQVTPVVLCRRITAVYGWALLMSGNAVSMSVSRLSLTSMIVMLAVSCEYSLIFMPSSLGSKPQMGTRCFWRPTRLFCRCPCRHDLSSQRQCC